MKRLIRGLTLTKNFQQLSGKSNSASVIGLLAPLKKAKFDSIVNVNSDNSPEMISNNWVIHARCSILHERSRTDNSRWNAVRIFIFITAVGSQFNLNLLSRTCARL